MNKEVMQLSEDQLDAVSGGAYDLKKTKTGYELYDDDKLLGTFEDLDGLKKYAEKYEIDLAKIENVNIDELEKLAEKYGKLAGKYLK